jgi:hypothetical protein
MDKRPDQMDWEAFQEDLRNAIDRLGIPLCGDTEDVDSEPEFKDGHVAFNGIQDDSAGDFVLYRDPVEFDHCKTYQRPYDLAVMVALIIADHHFGMFEFHATSDGSPKDWESALRFVREHFDYGDFPFDEDDIRRSRHEAYAQQEIADYRSIRTDLRISTTETV